MGTESTSDGGASSRTPGQGEVYCRDCGSIIRERAEICPECGVRQRSVLLSNVGDPGIAAIASLFIPGAGQILLGHIERGLLFIAATFIAVVTSPFLVGIPFLLGVWVYAIYDAYKLGDDPTRASRVWGADPGATPVADFGKSSTESTEHDPAGTAAEGASGGSVVGESDNRPGVDTDVSGDRGVPEDDTSSGETADSEKRTD